MSTRRQQDVRGTLEELMEHLFSVAHEEGNEIERGRPRSRRGADGAPGRPMTTMNTKNPTLATTAPRNGRATSQAT